MQLTGPFSYRLAITEDGRGYEHDASSGHRHFCSPATSRSPKLYVFSSARMPIYVGQTVQSMSARLRLGFTADGSTGYHGYRWRHHFPAVDLDVWSLDEADEDTEMPDLETIEAELVFLIWQHTGHWPSYQTEIHFYPSSEAHRRLAQAIFDYFYPSASTRTP